MKKEDLFEAMGDIRPEYIEESENVQRGVWRKYVFTAVSAAAMLAISVGAVQLYQYGKFGAKSGNPGVEEPAKNLPKINRFAIHSEGGCYETCLCDDLENTLKYASDILLETPKKLYPVYEGYGSYDEIMMGQAGKQMSSTEFDKLAQEFADKADTKISSIKVTYRDADSESKEKKDKIESKTYHCDNGILIEVSCNGDVFVQFKNKVASPALSSTADKYQRSEDFYHYYFEAYHQFFDFDKISYTMGAVDPDVKLPKEIIPLNFHDEAITGDSNNYYDISVIPGDGKTGDAIDFTRVDYGKCIGKYPIISKEEATKQLLAGKGITLDTLFDQISEERISGVTLSYLGEVPQPVYTFYLKLNKKETEEAFSNYDEKPTQQAYIKYYVPAVAKEYLK